MIYNFMKLQQYQDIWYAYDKVSKCWIISNQEEPVGATIGWFADIDFRIDQAIDCYRADLENHTKRQRSCPIDYD